MAVESSYTFDSTDPADARRRRRRIAEQLMAQGMDTSPIGSPWQGAARMAQALMGGLELGMEDKKEREQTAAYNAHNSSITPTLFGGSGGGSPVVSALAGKPIGGPIKLGGFEPTVARTLEFEGGLNPRDTNGAPSNFGINAKANPDVDVMKLTPQGATDIYRKRYWDAIGADRMDPRLAHVAFDTAVIAGPGKANELLKASGGDPEKFLALREQFQNRLLAANPEKYGPYAKAWGNRIATLRSDVGAAGGGQPSGMMAFGAQPGEGGPIQVAQANTGTMNDASGRIQQLYAKAVHPMTSPANKTLLLAEIKRLQDANDPDKLLQRRATDLQIRKAERDLNTPNTSGIEVMRDPNTGEIVRIDKATGQATVVRQGQASNKAPETRVVKQPDGSEVALQWDTESKKWLPMDAPQGGNPVAAPLKLTGEQSKDQAFLRRSEKLIPRLEKQDQALLDNLSATGGKIPMVGNYLKSPEYRQAEQTARELLAVILRKDTGAAVTDQEMSQYSWIYLPQPGDDEGTILQKREGRRTAIDGLRRGLGGLDIILDQRDALLDRQSAAKAAPGTPVPAPTAKGAPGGPPAGVTAAEWKAMTPEERALWK